MGELFATPKIFFAMVVICCKHVRRVTRIFQGWVEPIFLGPSRARACFFRPEPSPSLLILTSSLFEPKKFQARPRTRLSFCTRCFFGVSQKASTHLPSLCTINLFLLLKPLFFVHACRYFTVIFKGRWFRKNEPKKMAFRGKMKYKFHRCII